MKSLLSAVLILMLSSPALAAPETHQLGPFAVSFNMNTNLIYHVLAPSPQENSLATIYPLVINTDNDTGALIRIIKYNQPVDSTLLMRGSLTLSTMRESGINATIPENLTIDDKEGFLISGAPMANENTAPGFVIFQSQYWLDSKDCECGPVSVGTTSVDITSTYPQDITMNLLNSLHIENAGFAASLAANITKNVTAPNKTNAANVTTAATIAPSGAEKVAEKPAPKQPGFEGFLAIMGILAMGYIRLIRRQ